MKYIPAEIVVEVDGKCVDRVAVPDRDYLFGELWKNTVEDVWNLLDTNLRDEGKEE